MNGTPEFMKKKDLFPPLLQSVRAKKTFDNDISQRSSKLVATSYLIFRAVFAVLY